MAEFKSRYGKLGFYVNGAAKYFSNGRYSTDDKAEIEVLITLPDVEVVNEPKKAEEPAATKRKTSEK
jgi:hypothetical protein